MRPLLIDKKAKAAIQAVLTHAKSRPHTIEILKARMAGNYSTPGDEFGKYSCFLEVGFKCVYTIEEQPFGWCHHLSISVDAPGKLPHMEAVKAIMQEFGIKKPVKECHVYIEDCPEEKFQRQAINLLCPFEPQEK